ncbi:putative lipoprotein [Ralstonia insidiosa]|uniref:Lipoprotein n=1 Tax=Ralstonia insidiosa TaxID=190721 RepID=A0AAC9FR84_9RALS|nr:MULTISPECIES: hypothetical protein [Ralstonia]ANH73664.1 putative lipoprotein [Ralstonia insidiosa]EPX97741.1 hypothetical protein C404_11860 [Ralstonia sp. AU12-08]MBY4703862.1 hypothetical protein [Ralstonia insidiosa]GAQ31160.1 hypothetical protein SAMD00023378_4843 [Ralstonia sp. NT80]
MKKALYAPSLVLLALLGACGSSSPPQQQLTDQAKTDSTASADSGWIALRIKYMDCTQRRADDGVPGNAQTKAVVSSALDACADDLQAMHDAFRDHLSAQMSSSGARKAADRVTQETRDKARVYLTSYVDYARYQAKSR